MNNSPYPTLEVYSKDDVLVAHYCMSADSSFKYRDLKNKSGVYLFINPELNKLSVVISIVSPGLNSPCTLIPAKDNVSLLVA